MYVQWYVFSIRIKAAERLYLLVLAYAVEKGHGPHYIGLADMNILPHISISKWKSDHHHNDVAELYHNTTLYLGTTYRGLKEECFSESEKFQIIHIPNQ